jgi:hypothetical protein
MEDYNKCRLIVISKQNHNKLKNKDRMEVSKDLSLRYEGYEEPKIDA